MIRLYRELINLQLTTVFRRSVLADSPYFADSRIFNFSDCIPRVFRSLFPSR